MKFPCRKKRSAAAAAVMAALAYTGIAQSAAPEFHGYFRMPVFGSNDKGGGQVCFDLAGTREKATGRYGNECGTFTELDFSVPVYEDKDGVKFKYEVMPAWFSSNPEDNVGGNQNGATGSSTAFTTGLIIKQNFVSATGGVFGKSEVWMGRRYYRRYDIHAMDWYYIGNDAVNGFGVQNMDAGVGKISAALLYDDNTNNATASGRSLRFDWSNIPVNPNGELEVVLVSRSVDQNDSAATKLKDGTEISVQHTQNNLLGGFNRVALQRGTDAAGSAGLGSQFNFTTDDITTTRLVEHLVIAPNSSFSAFFAVVLENNEVGSAEDKWRTVLARPMFHWSKYFHSVVEVSQSEVKYGTGTAAVGQTGKMTKYTIAPLVIRPGSGPWQRPELRLFYTKADWNDAANARAGGNAVSGSDFTGSNATSGSVIGAQVEAWW